MGSIKRNRADEAKQQGKRMTSFVISRELDALINRVANALAVEMGGCTRTQALERMGREGAKNILEKPK